jgi:hypothetical protein
LNFLESFVDFLAKQWSESPDPLHPFDFPDIGAALRIAGAPASCVYRPWHWYPITTHPCWQPWKAGGVGSCSLALQRPARGALWWCDSLREASTHYSWTLSPHGTFVFLSAQLRNAMTTGNVHGTAYFCHRIFDWGGVARSPNNKSRRWIDAQQSAGTLIQALDCAVAHLQPQAAALMRFDFNGAGLPMNSATTKLFSAADPTGAILIFDGRVGAALCLLVRRFLELHAPMAGVPPHLLFYWGPHGTKPAMRNPSTAQFTFKDINRVTNVARAQASQRANEVARLLHVKAGIAQSDLERALFMVGYAVN